MKIDHKTEGMRHHEADPEKESGKANFMTHSNPCPPVRRRHLNPRESFPGASILGKAMDTDVYGHYGAYGQFIAFAL